MIVLVNSTPDRIPADVIAEEQDRLQEKNIDAGKNNAVPVDAKV